MKKKITRKEIADLCSVSPSTVSRSLTDHPSIPETTRSRVKSVAEQHGYIPSELSKQYYQGKSFRLGFVVPSCPDSTRMVLPYEYFTQTMYGLTQSATTDGYTINVIVDTGLDSAALEKLVLSHAVDGLIFIGIQKEDSRFKSLHKAKVPFVFIHHYEEGKPYPFVDCDPDQGVCDAFKYISKKQVCSIGYLSAGDGFHNSSDRYNAVKKYATQHGIDMTVVVDGDYSRTSGQEASEAFLKNGLPNVIFCANDRMAFGLIEVLREKGIRTPEDVGIIGFDNQEICTHATPHITTIENPFYKIGELATQKLIDTINGKEVGGESLPSKFIPRDSVKPIL